MHPKGKVSNMQIRMDRVLVYSKRGGGGCKDNRYHWRHLKSSTSLKTSKQKTVNRIKMHAQLNEQWIKPVNQVIKWNRENL